MSVNCKPGCTPYVRIWSRKQRMYWRQDQCGYTPDIYHAGIFLRDIGEHIIYECGEKNRLELQDVAADYCDHPRCGAQTACSRPSCPIKMEYANGRWQWRLPGQKETVWPWPNGIKPGGYSRENWGDNFEPKAGA